MYRILSMLLFGTLLTLSACGMPGPQKETKKPVTNPEPPPPPPGGRGGGTKGSGLGVTSGDTGSAGPAADPVVSPKAPEPSTRLAAPPPTAGLGAGMAAVTFTFKPQRARAGQAVTLTLSAPVSADVYFGGKKLDANAQDDGRVLRVTLPKGAATGYFELRANGRTFKADTELVIE